MSNSTNPYYVEKTCALLRNFVEENNEFAINIINMRGELAVTASLSGTHHRIVRLFSVKNGALLIKEVRGFLHMIKNCARHDLSAVTKKLALELVG